MAYYIQENCVACQKCKVEMPRGRYPSDGGQTWSIDEAQCVSCGTCAVICNEGAPIDLNAPPALPALHPLLEKDCDLLVLGGGGSGLVAAARAAWLSGKRVNCSGKRPQTRWRRLVRRRLQNLQQQPLAAAARHPGHLGGQRAPGYG